MAKIHKVSGYLVDPKGWYNGDDIYNAILKSDLTVIPHHVHIESVNMGAWKDNNPLNYDNPDLAECEKWFLTGTPNDKKVDANRVIYPGELWKHFKGHTVKILYVAQDTESVGMYHVIYEHDNKIWSRPLGMFLSEVDHVKYPDVKQKYRFEKVEA